MEDVVLKHCLVVIEILTTVYIDDLNIWNEVQASKECDSLSLGLKICIPFVHLNALMIISHANKLLPILLQQISKASMLLILAQLFSLP